MKTAEEYSDDVTKLWSKFDWGEINFNQFKNYVKNYIEQAQKEAYNQAIDDAVNSVKVVNTKKLNFETGRWENVPLIDQTSILKLKK